MDAAPVMLHYCVTDAESQAGAPVFGGKERIKNTTSIFFRNPGSIILNAHLYGSVLGRDSSFKEDFSLHGNRLDSIL